MVCTDVMSGKLNQINLLNFKATITRMHINIFFKVNYGAASELRVDD